MYFFEKVNENIIRLGVNDRRLARFENMYPIPNGVSYNSYLVVGDKTVLMDTVDHAYMNQFFENLESALDGRDLDYLVVSHMEPDHSAAIAMVLKAYPNCKLVGNQKSFQFLEQFFHYDFKDRYLIVKDGDTLDIGGRVLKFVFAPMVHWPEVMFTLTDKGELFSSDAFGTFGAIEGHIYSDDIEMDELFLSEAARYYFNVVGKFGRNVISVLKKLDLEAINMILPLHGPIHRTKEKINAFVDKYMTWAAFEPEKQGVVIVFASMYGNTELVADTTAYFLSMEGVKNIKIYDVSETHASYIISEAHRHSNLIFTPINYNTELYPEMDALLRELVGTGYQSRKYSVITNGSWGGRSEKIAEEIIAKSKLEKIGETVAITSSATKEDEEKLKALAKQIADSLK